MMIDGEIGESTIYTLVKTQDEVRGNDETLEKKSYKIFFVFNMIFTTIKSLIA